MFAKFVSKVLRCQCVCFFVLILSVTGVSQAADIVVDGTRKFQIMNGFGVNANSERWNDGELIPALDTLVDTMGATVWRVVVESVQNWEITNDDLDAFNFNWTYYNSLYEKDKFQKLWGILGYLKQKNVDTIMLSVMGCLPTWMGGCTLNTSQEAEWVEMVVSLLYYARNTKNLRIDMFDPFNEPDITNEGPSMGETQYIRVLKKLIIRMDALGLGDIEIIGPTTAQLALGRDTWMPLMLNDSQIMGKARHFGLHSYSGDSSGVDSDIKGSAYPDRNFWMTEFSAWCPGCDTGGQPPDDWTFGSDTFDYLYNHINQGAASALIWEGYDSYYEHHNSWSYWGLLKYNKTTGVYTPRKRMYINAHVFRFVQPGAVRILTSTSQPDLTLLAFSHPDTKSLAIIGENSNSTALTINGTLAGLSPVTSMEFYQTTKTANFERNADVSVINNTFSAQVAANSFFTLSTISAPGLCEVTLPVTEGTIGTEIILGALSPCFGTKKGKVLLGDVATKQAVSTKIAKEAWTDSRIKCTVKKVPKGSPGTFPVTVKTKSEDATPFTLQGAFTVKLPEGNLLSSDHGAQGAEITITGNFFGTKNAKSLVYLGYTNAGDWNKLEKCKIISWGMNEIIFRVPKLPLGFTYPLSISNKVGTVAVGDFTIN